MKRLVPILVVILPAIAQTAPLPATLPLHDAATHSNALPQAARSWSAPVPGALESPARTRRA
jgi:hypothetical protein